MAKATGNLRSEAGGHQGPLSLHVLTFPCDMLVPFLTVCPHASPKENEQVKPVNCNSQNMKNYVRIPGMLGVLSPSPCLSSVSLAVLVSLCCLCPSLSVFLWPLRGGHALSVECHP